MKPPLFYKQKPIFGIDIGHGAVKVVQLFDDKKHQKTVGGYGYAMFDASAIDKQGVVVDVETIARAAYQLIEKNLIGSVQTDRVVATIPSARTFTRIVRLPAMADSELESAVRSEAEQYIPVPLDELYLDYEVAHFNKGKDETQEVLMVATPSAIIDSYLTVFSALGIEVAAIEPSLAAVVRAVSHSSKKKTGAVVIDFGSRSSDMSIFDGTTVRVTGTTKQGGEDLTEVLVKKLNITKRQAFHGKARYGINQNTKQGREIYTHARPMLDTMVTEIKKLLRYYKRIEESKQDIDQIILIGGGANLPGLDEFIAKQTGLTVSLCDPWVNISMGTLQGPNNVEKTLYTTAIGSALLQPEAITI